MLQYLARAHDVDLVVFRHRRDQDPAAALPSGLVRRICVIDLPHHRKDLVSRALRNAGRFMRGLPPLVDRFRGFGDAIERFVGGYRYEVGVIEHFWCAPYLPAMEGVCRSVVLNLHNVESVLHQTSGAAGGQASRALHGRFAQCSRELERLWLPRFTEVLTASQPDAERVGVLAPASKPRVFPNAIPWTPLPQTAEQNVIAFSGNLEYHPNQLAVEYFNANIWPEVKRRWPATVWRLIGMNPEAVSGILAGRERVELTGSVPDAVAELAAARIVVVPLLSGSGTRLKIVEAWAAGRAIVSTSLGAEGLPACDARNILLADTPDAFIAAIDKLLSDPKLRRAIGDAGRAEYERSLNWDAAWKLLDGSILFAGGNASNIEY